AVFRLVHTDRHPETTSEVIENIRAPGADGKRRIALVISVDVQPRNSTRGADSSTGRTEFPPRSQAACTEKIIFLASPDIRNTGHPGSQNSCDESLYSSVWRCSPSSGRPPRRRSFWTPRRSAWKARRQ